MGWMDDMSSILSDLEQKSRHVDHMFSLTRDLEKLFKNNDSDGVGLALEQRQEDIDAIKKIDMSIQAHVDSLSEPLQKKMKQMLSPDADEVALEDPLEYNIFDTNRRIVITMRKLRELDTAVRNSVQRKR